MIPCLGHPFFLFRNSPHYYLATNYRIILCSYYIQLSAMLGQPLCTTVDNVVRLFYDCPKLHNIKLHNIKLHNIKALDVSITASITSQ